jgi:hypothetical protein
LAARKKRATKGAPSKFTEALGDEICERIAGGESLRTICKDAHMPAGFTVRRWVVGTHLETEQGDRFREKYAQARIAQADHYFDEIKDLPDEAEHRDSAGVMAAKNRADSRKWILARMSRAKYGDQSSVQIGGDPNGVPVQQTSIDITHMSVEELAKLRELSRIALQSKGSS